MQVIITKDYKELSEFIGKEILINIKENKLICVPSGDTPLGAYEYVSQNLKNKNLNDYRFTFIGLDEWVGMDRNDMGSCQEYMYKYLFQPSNIPENKIIEFKAKAQDLEEECFKMDKYLKENGPLDLVVLGIGMNGHLGLNEPGIDIKYSHVVNLDNTTINTAQKYFENPTFLNKGITLGLKHFLDAKKVMLIASGIKKAEIIEKILKSDVTNSIPATIMKMHKNSYLIIDEESGSRVINEI